MPSLRRKLPLCLHSFRYFAFLFSSNANFPYRWLPYLILKKGVSLNAAQFIVNGNLNTDKQTKY